MKLSSQLLQTLQDRLTSNTAPIILRSGFADRRTSVRDSYSFGIEEEYFLVDARTFEIATTTPQGLFDEATWSTGGQAMREMMQSQIEVATNVHTDVVDAREELRFLRLQAATAADQFGLRIMACGTHPTARWRQMKLSPKARYIDMLEDLQQVGQRNMLCGMHIHVELPEPDRRVKIMSALIPYIPLFVALSTSSPFWHSQNTGLKGYRLAAYDELPRTGIPPLMRDSHDYECYVTALKKAGVIADESFIWWAVRPASRHPTLELRAPDCCTNVNDAIAIASLYRSLVRHLSRQPSQLPSEVDRAISIENKWRAQRYGTECVFVSREGLLKLSDFICALVERLAEDASVLGCYDEIEHCKLIAARGSSADQQLLASREGTLETVKQWLVRETMA